jgi:hypothetical protein
LNFNPFDAQASQVYKEKTQITDQNLTILLNSILGSFENETEYYQHDPITLAKRLPHLLKIIENGKHDVPYVKNQINSLFESLLLACKFASIT